MGNKSSTKTQQSVPYTSPSTYGRFGHHSDKQLNMDFSFENVAKQSLKTVVVSGYSTTFYAAQSKLTRGNTNTFSYSNQFIRFEHVEYGGRSYSDAKAVLEQGSVIGLMLTVQSLSNVYHLKDVLADYEYVYKMNEQSGKHLIPIVIYVDNVTHKDLYSYYNNNTEESNAMDQVSEALQKYENWQVVYGDQSGKAVQDALDYLLSFY